MARPLKAKIKIEADTKQASKSVKGLESDVQKALGAISAASAEINVDDDDARNKLQQLQKQLKDLDAAQATIGLDVDTDTARADLLKLQGSLDELDARKIITEVDVDTTDAQEGLEDLADSAGNADDKFNLLSATGAALVASLAAVAAAVAFATTSIVAEEEAAAQLNRALAELGAEAAGVSERLQSSADSLSRLTGITRAEIVASQALIASFVKEEEAIERLTKVSLDLATGRQIDTASAALVLGKSVGTATNALIEYAIEVDGAVGSTERMESAIEGVTAVYGGAAEAAGDAGLAGALKGLSTAVTNLTIDVGETSGGTAVLAGTAKEAQQQLNALGKETKSTGTFFGAFFRVLTGTNAAFFDSLKAIDAQVKESERLGVTVKELAEEQKRLADETARVAEEERKAAEAARVYTDENERLLASFRELGIVIIDENAELAKQEAIINDADEALRRNIITRAQFIEIERAARGETLNTSEALEDATSITDLYTAAVLEARAGLDLFATAERGSADAVVASSVRRAEARAAEASAAGRNLLGGTSSFAQIGGGTFSIPDATQVGVNGRVSLFGSGPSGAGISAG